jgi:hypothetical protein
MSTTKRIRLTSRPGVLARRNHEEYEARLRGERRLRELVVRQIRTGREPQRKDLAAALTEPLPNPQLIAKVPFTAEEEKQFFSSLPKTEEALSAWLREHISDERRAAAVEKARDAIAEDTRTLCEYVAQFYVLRTRRQPGRKPSEKTVAEKLNLAFGFYRALDQNRGLRSPLTTRRVKMDFAKKHALSVRVLERLIADFKPAIKT